MHSKNIFARFARETARMAGHPSALTWACLLIIGWAIAGPFYDFSDTWQLVINTTTTVITFLMVFLIQGSQNADSEAMHLKLDELIRSIEGAHNAFLDLEELSEQQLDQIKTGYLKLAKVAREKHGMEDIGRPELPKE